METSSVHSTDDIYKELLDFKKSIFASIDDLKSSVRTLETEIRNIRSHVKDKQDNHQDVVAIGDRMEKIVIELKDKGKKDKLVEINDDGLSSTKHTDSLTQKNDPPFGKRADSPASASKVTPNGNSISTAGFGFGNGLSGGTSGLTVSSSNLAGLSGSTGTTGGLFNFGGTSSASTTPISQRRPLYGATTTSQSGFGFGAATGTQQANSIFEKTTWQGGSVFGRAVFGAAKPAGSEFGTGGTNAFGSSAPAGGGIFGGGGASGSTGTTGGLFGAQSTTTFGQQPNPSGFSFGGTTNTSGGLFGSTSQANTGSSLFSTPASGTGFGGAKPGFSGFGTSTNQPATGGLFGQTNSTPSLFGQTGATSAFGGATAAAGGGTTTPFQPPTGQDTMMKSGVTTSISTKHQCITAMKEYENKSLEELRMEDYTANRKSKQTGGTTGGLFGQTPASSGGSFVFGSGGGGLGSGLQSGGTTGFGGFGGTSSASTTPFSQNRPLFGATTTTQSGFGFGAATGTQQSSSLFGNAARPLFGGATTSQPSLTGGTSFFGGSAAGTTNPVGFGATTGTQGGSVFGAAKPGGFGTSTSSSFGFGTGGNLFGKPTTQATSTFGFGTSTSSSGFGTGTTGSSLFNASKPPGFGGTSTGLGTFGGFGSGLGTGTATNAFGTNAAKPGGFGTFNFGGTSTSTSGFGTGLGGGTNTFNLGGGATTLATSTASSQANSTQHLLALASSPYGDNPLFWNLKQQSKERRDEALKPTNPNAQKAALLSANQYKVSPRPSTKIKPKSLHNLINGGKAQLFEGLEDEDLGFGDDTFVPRKSVKKLVLRKGGSDKSVSGSSSFYSDTGGDILPRNNSSSNKTPSLITRPLNLSQESPNDDNEAEAAPSITREPESTPKRPPSPLSQQHLPLDDSIAVLNQKTAAYNFNQSNSPKNRLTAADTTTSFVDTSDLDNSCLGVENSCPHPTGITLTRPGYYTMPALDDLIELMDENGNVNVENFTIGRVGYGTVFFPGVTNVAGMNLDEIVHFRRKEVVVYPDDDKKPPLGDGLNKKAEITLDCVWPSDKSTRTPIKSPERLKLMNYSQKIEETTAKIGATFIDYRPETGSWVFQVRHFSKYGLNDSDDEEYVDPKVLAHSKDILLVQKLKVQQQQLIQAELAKKASLGQDQNAGLMQQGEMQGISLEGKQGEEMMQGDLEDELCEDDSFEMQEADEEQMKLRSKLFPDENEMDTSLDSKYLASSMGVKAKHIQGMKASFFGDELDEPKVKGHKEEKAMPGDGFDEDIYQMWKKKSEVKSSMGLFGSFKHPASLSLPQSPAFSDKDGQGWKEGYEPVTFGKSGLFDGSGVKELARPTPQTFLHPPVMEHKLVPSGLKPSDVPPPITGTLVRHSIVHPKDSLLYKNQESIVDAACFMGRSFRTGWGPNLSLVQSGNSIGLSDENPLEVSLLPSSGRRSKPTSQIKSWIVHQEQVQIEECRLEKEEELLSVQLDHSRLSMEGDCPLIVPEPGVTGLLKVAEIVKDSLADAGSSPDFATLDQMNMVLGLCVALWNTYDIDKDEIYRESQLRREAVSKWLSETSSSRVASEIETISTLSPEGCLKAVFSKLSVQEISQACMLAQTGGDHRMALLIAQAVGGIPVRQMINLQLEKWAEMEVNQFISEARQKIYCLLAGQLLWCSKDREINTCKDMDWKRALALHLWYKCPSNAPIQQALKLYQQGFQGTKDSKPYCTAPLPPYIEQEGQASSTEHIYDTAYHLLCLFADEKYPLEALLSPTSSVPSNLEFRLSWHLLQTLQALGYRHLSSSCADSLHVSFASQLEALGLWQWAAFVLLHIPDHTQRQTAVQTLLQRHLQTSTELTDKERFLVDKLQIPEQWLHQAKAVRAGYEGNHDAECQHWLLAGQYNKAHSVMIKHIAADAIINDNYAYLRTFLDEMSPPERSFSILNWSSKGKVFLDFILLQEKVEQLKQTKATEYDLEELEPMILSLSSRVKGLEVATSKDRLCQAEISKTVANFLMTFHLMQGKSSVRTLTKYIPELPMPEDYTLQKLQALTRAQLMEIS